MKRSTVSCTTHQAVARSSPFRLDKHCRDSPLLSIPLSKVNSMVSDMAVSPVLTRQQQGRCFSRVGMTASPVDFCFVQSPK